MSKKTWVLLCVILATNTLFSQTTKEVKHTSKDVKYNLEIEGYIDLNYNRDLNNPKNQSRLFSSNPLYSNQFGMSYAYLQTAFHDSNTKATIALHQGTIVDLMYAGEKDWIKTIREASITQQLNHKFDLEIGILPSIFGF